MLYFKLIYILIGLGTGIYCYSKYYICLLAIIPILYKRMYNILFILPAFCTGIIIAHSQKYIHSGIITYTNQDYIFIENKGLYKCNNNNFKIGDKIQFASYNNKITKIYSKTTNKPILPMFIIHHRNKVINLLQHSKHYPFWLAIIIGDKSMLENTTTYNFISSGIYHLLIISGFHFSILYQIIYFVTYNIFSRIKKLNYLCTIYAFYDIIPKTLATIICIYYFLLSLFSISSTRVILMLLLSFTNYSSKTILIFSMILMLIYNPTYAYNIGFILSFLGTYMLINKDKSYDITVAASPFTGIINPLAVINNIIGSALISIIATWGFTSCILNSPKLLIACDPIIGLTKTTFSKLNFHTQTYKNNNILIIFIAFLYMYIIFNKKYFIYMGYIVFIIGHLIITPTTN